MKEKYLPIGTIVLLKGGKKELMIMSYCVYPNNIQLSEGQELKPEKRMYDYGACLYPEGILEPNTLCAFDHEQIEKICHLGYETPIQAELSELTRKGYEMYKDRYENSENYTA